MKRSFHSPIPQPAARHRARAAGFRLPALARAPIGMALIGMMGRGLRCCLAVGVLGLVGAVGLVGQGDSVRDSHASRYRPGGMEPREARRALDHDALALDGCLRAGEVDRSAPARAQLGRLFEILSTSETGREILSEARLRDVRVCVDEQTDLLAYYFAGARVVGVSAALSEGGKLAFLAHELAHVPQHPAYSDNRYYPPDDLVLLRRVREAAAEAVATRIAWELRENGYDAPWDERAATPYGDVARAFETAVAADRSAEGLLRATRAAFDCWFDAPWRLDVYDRMTLGHLARISEDAMGLVPPRYALTHLFLADIAWLGGRNFLTETGAPALTGRAYAGRISGRNDARLERFRDRVTGYATAFGTALVAGLVY